VGIEELKQACDYIHAKCPDVPIILDFKRGDIGNTNQNYAIFAFDYIGADAITVQPYLGKEAVQAFLDYKDKGIMVLCRTSNPGSGELQDLEVNGRKLYQVLAQNVKDSWNENGNCQLVVGATYPDELSEVRKIVGEDMVLLVPGVGAQGADIEATLKAGINKSGRGIIVNSGRDILYASSGTDFAEAAKKRAQETRDEINKYRKKG
jgi:orotidine-5'-phosphate decarboxylase